MAAEAEAERKRQEGGDVEEGAANEEGSEKDDGSEVASPKSAKEGEEKAEVEGAEEKVLSEKEEVKEEEPAPEPVKKRKRFLHHPFTEQDYLKRRASSEYAKIKEVEDKVLNFKKENVKTYVISAGVLYGLGEAIFNHHFERAWK